MAIKKQVIHYSVDTSKFTKEQLAYLDYERMDETCTIFTFPESDKNKVMEDDIMDDKYYKFFASFLQYQYKLPVKYLEPDIDACYYISQKTPLDDPNKPLTSASITIEPLNQNVFKQISYTPINQAFDIGTVVSLHEIIPYVLDNGDTPPRGLLTSASLVCPLLNDNKVKYKGLCNRCIPYTTIDVGSEVVGKFIIKTSPLRESMALYRFRRPRDNILEIVTPDYLNVSCNYILDLTLSAMMKDNKDKQFADIIKEMKDA